MTTATSAEPRHRRERVHATAFKDAVGRFPSGVTVVAVRRDGAVTAKTVSAFSSLSLEPPLIGVAIGGHTPLAALLRAGGAFGVSVLAHDQAAVSDWFARPPQRREGTTPPADFVTDQHPEAPVLDRCLSRLCCRVVDVVGAGDHVVAVGEVQAVRVAAGTPLLHHAGRYRALHPDHHPVPTLEAPTP
jgi:flavin reductase (DIM6/NTAB) family NADH-FMN oxidoreductase RutF